MPGILEGTPKLQPAKRKIIYGVRHKRNAEPPQLERLEDSAEFSFQSQWDDYRPGFSDFDKKPIYEDIRLCNMINGKVLAYEGDKKFTRTPVPGESDVVVEVPRFYFKIEDIGDYRYYYACNQPEEGFEISPRHAPYASNPQGHDKIYIGAYLSSLHTVNGASLPYSISGQIPGSLPILNWRNSLQYRSSSYYQVDYATYCTLMILMIIETASFDTQTAIGRGGYTPDRISGTTDVLKYHSGETDNPVSASYGTPMKYRNIEHLWGGGNWLVDGIRSSTWSSTYGRTYFWWDPTRENAEDYYYLFSNSSIGFIREMGGALMTKGILFPTLAGGNASTYYCDQHSGAIYGGSTYNYAKQLGGFGPEGSNGYFQSGVTGLTSALPTRILYLPPPTT